jgi:hypothetical protein
MNRSIIHRFLLAGQLVKLGIELGGVFSKAPEPSDASVTQKLLKELRSVGHSLQKEFHKILCGLDGLYAKAFEGTTVRRPFPAERISHPPENPLENPIRILLN